jgi:hypothetical protein
MITLEQLTAEVISQVSGAIYNDESKFSEKLVHSIIHQCRAQLISQKRFGSFPDILYQRYYPVYTESEQIDDCLVEFKVPDYINTEVFGDGMRYVGNINEFDAFTRLGKGVMKSVYSKHRVSNPKNRKDTMWSAALDETGYTKIQIYNNVEIEQFVVIGIMANPEEATYFREDTDAYPISADMIPMLKEMVSQQMYIMAQTPADTISNSQDSPTLPASQIPNTRRRR